MTGTPVKAFLYQDHEAHITVHMSAMQDPKIAALIGQSPQAQAIQAATAAHIAEHLAFAYRKQIEEQLGVELPDPEDEIPKEAELGVSRAAAEAAKQLLAKNQNEAAQQQAQQQAQDPLIQMQQQELQLKAQEVQIKAEKAKADIELDKARLEVDVMRIQSEERKAGAQLGAKAESDKMSAKIKQELEGVKLGVDMAKNKAQQATQLQQAEINAQRQQPTGETE
jgi:hypothetical protein